MNEVKHNHVVVLLGEARWCRKLIESYRRRPWRDEGRGHPLIVPGFVEIRRAGDREEGNQPNMVAGHRGAGRFKEPGGVRRRKAGRASALPRPTRRLGAGSALRGLPGAAALSPARGPHVPLQGFRNPGPAAPSGPHQWTGQRGPEARSGCPPFAAAASGSADLLFKAEQRGRPRKKVLQTLPHDPETSGGAVL